MYLGSWKIDDLVTFACNTHDPETAGNPAIDADDPPTYRIYEDETGTPILTGSMAKLDDANTVGFYSEQITLSAANGFEKGKSYHIRVAAVVGGVTGITERTLQVEAEVDANVVSGAVPSVTGAVGSVTGNVGGNVAGSVGSVVGAVGSVTGAVGSVTGNVGGNVTGSVGSVATGGITAASIASGAIDRDAFAADTGLQSIRSNTAQAGGANTITLDASASADDDFYNGASILLTGGTGAGQYNVITDYNGTTKVATVRDTWVTNPSSDTTFAIFPGAETASDIATAVWAAAARTLTAATNITSTGGTTVPQTGDSFARLGAPAGASVSADIGALPTASVTATQVRTELGVELARIDVAVSSVGGVDAAGVRAAIGLASANLDDQLAALPTDADVLTQINAALQATVADSVPADGTRPSIAQGIYMLTQFMVDREVVGTEMTIRKPDGTTVLFTITLNSALTPTRVTRTA